MTALLPTTAISNPLSATVGPTLQLNGAPRNLTVQANFAGGTSGSSVDAYVQTTLDGGNTWTDICNFHFTTSSARKVFNLSAATPVTSIATPSDGALSANSAQDGVLGPQFRTKYQSSGTYSSTSLRIDVASIDLPATP
jgi:hypothetical protein